jgi:hypothetical protein
MSRLGGNLKFHCPDPILYPSTQYTAYLEG